MLWVTLHVESQIMSHSLFFQIIHLQGSSISVFAE